MRYTSESTMDDRALRDVERWKDKIEVRLDNRQVFFLFFGSALVACLLFILGVIVGKRLESRGKAVAPEIEDPLALLDKVAATPRVAPEGQGPSLPKVLMGAARPARAIAEQKEPKPAQPKAAQPAMEPKVDPEVEPNAEAKAAEPKAEPKPEPKVAEAKAAERRAAPLAAKPTVAALAPKQGTVAVMPPPVDPTKARKRFTLQLGAFADRAEADAFAKRFTAQSAYVIPSEIPGKGIWFRVRAGDYATAKDAIAAKANFEKQHGVIAYVVPPPPH
jgi:DedD protein